MSLFEMAKSWIDVPFRLHGYDKRGCDCIGLVIGVLYENNILDADFLKKIKKIRYGTNLQKINISDVMDKLFYFFNQTFSLFEADLLLAKTTNSPIHFVIFEKCININNSNIIHITQEVGRVFETKFDKNINICRMFKLTKS